MLRVIHSNCAGLDVHKKFAVACRLMEDGQGSLHRELRVFPTMTADLEALADC